MNKIFGKFRQDITGILFLGAGSFLALALISFNPSDPSFNSTGSGLQVANYCGYVGSFLADLIYQAFGPMGWLFVIGGVFCAIHSFQGKELILRDLRCLWLFLLAIVAASLLALYFPETRLFGGHISVGGFFGEVISKSLLTALNYLGVSVVLWSSFLIFLMFFLEKTLSEIFLSPTAKLSPLLETLRIPSLRECLQQLKTSMSHLFQLIGSRPAYETGSTPRPVETRQPRWALKRRPTEELEESEDEFEDEAEYADEEEEEDDEEFDDIEVMEKVETRSEQENEQKLFTKKRKVRMKAKAPKRIENWNMPKLSLIEDPPLHRIQVDEREIKKKAELLVEKLSMFNVNGKVMAARPGPAVTMYEFKPNSDVRLSKITDLADDLSLALSSESLRIIAPIPGRDVVGIETSNSDRETVYLKDLLAENEFWSEDVKLPLCLGREANGTPKIVDLRKMPHLLVAGSTGSGKSVFTVSSIVSLLVRHSPKTLRMILVDPKQVDLAVFSDIPHLIMPPIREPKKAVSALRWAIHEMEKRYRSMSKFGARGIEGFNETVEKLTSEQIQEHEAINQEYEENGIQKLQQYYYTAQPYIVIVVEEFGDLMAVDKNNVEQAVVRLAQMARACGIHLILAMQSPRKEVVTGLIKTNIPGRISFKVASKMDSRIIMDEAGAERLLARGDMLFLSPGVAKPERHHGPWLPDSDIQAVTDFWAKQGEPEFDPLAMKVLEGSGGGFDFGADGAGDGISGDEEYDERYDEILGEITNMKEVSASLLQRKFKLGYPRAARMIEIMEREGVVGPANGSKPRQVLVKSYDESK